MLTGYLSLFGLSFLAATILPMGSEILLLSLASADTADFFMLWLVATLGNTLGSMVNYGLGRYLLHYQARTWFPIKATALTQYQHLFNRYGYASMLFAWLPIVGDVLTLIAGSMKMHFGWFCLLVFIGKGIRYALVLGAGVWVLG